MSDYEFINHKSAAKVMGISRPTFAEIYKSPRKKTANLMLDVKEIKTVYGNAIQNKIGVCAKNVMHDLLIKTRLFNMFI